MDAFMGVGFFMADGMPVKAGYHHNYLLKILDISEWCKCFTKNSNVLPAGRTLLFDL
jgi:hypothetical protein